MNEEKMEKKRKYQINNLLDDRFLALYIAHNVIFLIGENYTTLSIYFK